MPTCKLCQTDQKLLNKSHIIPDFYYRDCELYDGNHQLRIMKADGNVPKFIPDKKRINTGIYDRNILCSTCDNERLGKLESYLRPFFFGGQIGVEGNPVFKNFIDPKGKKFIQLTNISYLKAKLGLLSILWRASISKQEFFKSVTLDSTTKEELRLMLLNQDPSEISRFPVVCLSIIGQNKSFLQVIAAPQKMKNQYGSGFVFLMGGIFFLFYISHNFYNDDLERNTISPTNKMTIFEIEEDGMGWILSYFGFKKK